VSFPASELDLPKLGHDDGWNTQVGTHGFRDSAGSGQWTREDRIESESREEYHSLRSLGKTVDGQWRITAALDLALQVPGCFGVTHEIDGFHAEPLDLWLLIVDIMWTKSRFEKGATL
jgi:hypothetical protein